MKDLHRLADLIKSRSRIKAELHGKFPSDNPGDITDRLDDFLLSDFFGPMKYTGWQYGYLSLEWRDTVADMMIEPRSAIKYANVFPDAQGWD